MSTCVHVYMCTRPNILYSNKIKLEVLAQCTPKNRQVVQVVQRVYIAVHHEHTAQYPKLLATEKT